VSRVTANLEEAEGKALAWRTGSGWGGVVGWGGQYRQSPVLARDATA